MIEVVVTFHDGTREIVEGSDVNVQNNVLHVNNRVGVGYSNTEHVASFPLVSIRRYVLKEQ